MKNGLRQCIIPRNEISTNYADKDGAVKNEIQILIQKLEGLGEISQYIHD